MIGHDTLIDRAIRAHRLRCQRMGLEPGQPCCARSDVEEDNGAILVVLRNVNCTLATYHYHPQQDRLKWIDPENLGKPTADNRSRVNLAESARCAAHRDVRAQWGHCYANACRIIWYVPGYANADYVEGIAVMPEGVLIEHGWVEQGGEIIDPLHSRIEGVAYFPGLRIHGRSGLAEMSVKDYHDRVVFHPDLPIFYRFGWGGSDSPEFSRARADATEYVRGRFLLDASCQEGMCRPIQVRPSQGVLD